MSPEPHVPNPDQGDLLPSNHRPFEFVRMVGWIWECGDPVCDCTKHQILEEYHSIAHPHVKSWRIVWEGAFASESIGQLTDEEYAVRRDAYLEQIDRYKAHDYQGYERPNNVKEERR